MVVITLLEAAQDLDWAEVSTAQKSNARVYTSLSLGSNTELEMASSSYFIRLLEVHPGHEGQLIVGTLKIVDFSEADVSSYEAILYVWGPNMSQVIYVNKQPMRVSHTLSRARRHLSKLRTMWIDAICISQVDLAERGSQVLLMQKIYSTAKSVVVWLGKSPRGLSHTLTDVTKVSKDEHP
ncbi:heterokaryon incompatibility protein-domain-containing protein [Xylariaceae sp. FL1651]|nr:heterokaryon incompatibility protein-domain-containing protein [Xylariaceae sp. FL1651]